MIFLSYKYELIFFKFLFPSKFDESVRDKKIIKDLHLDNENLKKMIEDQNEKIREFDMVFKKIQNVLEDKHERLIALKKHEVRNKEEKIEKEAKKEILLVLTGIFAYTSDKIPRRVKACTYPNLGKYEWTAKLESTYSKKNHSVLIEDFNSRDQDKGIGSIVLQSFLDICDENKIKKAWGEISEVDWDHVDKLKNLYEKFGFLVTLNDEKKNGSIKRYLPNIDQKLSQ